MAIKLTTWSPCSKIYHGDKCNPKTVCITILDSPDANIANVWISIDKNALDQAEAVADSTGQLPYISEGLPVQSTLAGQDFPSQPILVIPNCTSDLYARAINFVSGDPTPTKELNQLMVIAIGAF